MLRIIGRITSGNVMKPLWAADEIGVDYEQVDWGGVFGGNDDPEYRAMNPMGLVPTLVDGDFTLFESNAITRYLCAKHSQGALCPADLQTRATAEAWMDWTLTAVNPFMRDLFWGLVRSRPQDRDMDRIGAAIKEGIRIWSMLDRHLEGRRFIAGNEFTMGDIPLGPQAHRWMMLVEDRPSLPNFDAWYQRLTERPSFRKHCMIPLE